MNKNIAIVVKIGISIGLLYWLIGSMDFGKILNIAKSADVKYVALMLAILIVVQFIAIYRWGLVLKRDIDVDYKTVGSITFVGLFFNNFLPTIIGGDAVKAYYLYKHSGRGKDDSTLSNIFASILMDRYSGFTALMVIASLSLVFGYSLIAGTDAVVACIGIILFYFTLSLFIWVEFFHSWLVALLMKIGLYGINEKIDKFYKSLMGYKNDRSLIIKICLTSIFVQVGVILSFASMGYGLGIDISIWYYFLFIPVTTVVVMVPVSLSGIGVRESIMVYMFSFGGANSEEVLVMSVMWFAGLALISMAGGIEYVRLGGGREFAENKK